MKHQQRFGNMKLIAIVLVLALTTLACGISASNSQLSQAFSTPLAAISTEIPAQIQLPTAVVAQGQNSTESPVQTQAPATNTSQSVLNPPQAVKDEDSLLIQLYKQVNPSVVNITIYTQQQGQELPLAQGSGFVFDQNGHIATNAHVVHGADQVEVGFYDGTIVQAQTVGEDLNSDLAIVKVDSYPSGVKPLPLGNQDDVQVGETVVAIGNPFGLEGTLTKGIVSAIGRTIPALTPFSIPQAIQTDAPINPGNSGGPLLNLNGQVIGINAQIETGTDNQANSGVGFAVPVSILKRVLPELVKSGHYDWPWLGVRGTTLTPTIAQAMNLPVQKGAYITSVIPGGPAEKAGLRGANDNQLQNSRMVPVGGDVVTAINGSPINSFDDLLIYVAFQAKPGQEITLTIVRNGKTQDIKLTLEPRPASLNAETTLPAMPTVPPPQ